MTRTEDTERAEFETTRRLLAGLINEGLVDYYLERLGPPKQSTLCLQALGLDCKKSPTSDIVVGINSNALVDEKGNVLCPIAAEQLELPVWLEDSNGQIFYETNPSKILQAIHEWIPGLIPDDLFLEKAKAKFQSCVDNQKIWLQFHAQQRPCDLNSPVIDWERTLTFGHPEHPLHRCLYPESPLLPSITADDLMTPEISFISVPNAKIETTGPFRAILQPLLERLGLSPPESGQTIIPCFTVNLPLVTARIPEASVIQYFPNIAESQVSVRSVSLRSDLGFKHGLKMSLPFQITGGFRHVRPWEALQAPYMTELVERLAPPDLWICRDPAAIRGINMDEKAAQTIACIVREDLEPRTLAQGQSLVIAAALNQRAAGGTQTYAELLFGLKSKADKCAWIQRYFGLLFPVVLPLLGRGMALEAHSQNLMVRVDKRNKTVLGFALRDMNGVKLHVPTLQSQGIAVDKRLAQMAETQCDGIKALWKRCSLALIQCHAMLLLRSLGLDNSQGWSIVRNELENVLLNRECPMGQSLHKFFLAQNTEYPCYLRASLPDKRLETESIMQPNILLR